MELPLDDTDNGQLESYLRVKGFSPFVAFYVTDTLRAYQLDDLKHVSLYDINKKLDDLNQWEYELLKSVCNGVRKHYDMLTLLQESQANQEAVRMELAAREAHYLAHSSAAGSSSTAGSSSAADSSSASKQYLVAYASLSEIARFLKERGFTEKNVELITRELNITEVWQLSNVSESVLDKVCKNSRWGIKKSFKMSFGGHVQNSKGVRRNTRLGGRLMWRTRALRTRRAPRTRRALRVH